MARIPAGEEFGQQAARPQRAPEVVPGANGEAIGQALTGFGQDLQRIDQQQLRERRALRDAADRGQTDAAIQTNAVDLGAENDTFIQAVKGGQIAKDQAAQEWQRISDERIAARLESVPQAYRAQTKQKMDLAALSFGRNVSGAILEKDQSDTWSSIMVTAETSQRMAVKDPEAADRLMNLTLEQQGPFSGKTTAQLQAFHQNWKEGVAQNRVATMILGARNSNAQLDAVLRSMDGEEFANLTPQNRTTLIGQIEGFKTSNIQRAEAARARAEAQARAKMERAQAEFIGAQGRLDSGKLLSHAEVERVTSVMAGTPYMQAFKDMVAQRDEGATFAMQPLAVQRQGLINLQARLNVEGTSKETDRRQASLQRIYEQSVRDYREEPLLAAQDRGLIQSIAPLDTSSIATTLQGLAQRTQQARIAATQVGHPVSPLLSTEAERVSKLIQALPIEQKSDALAQLSEVVGPATATALSKQILPKDLPMGISMGMATAQTTYGRKASELVLKGAQALKDKAIKEDNAAVTGVRAQIAKEIGSAINGPDRETAVMAALYTYYGKQSEGDSVSVRSAVRLALGGIEERNGRKIVLPYGMPPADFDKKLQQFNAQSIAGQLEDGKVYVGQTPMSADDFVKNLPKAALITSGNGRYTVQAGGGLVTNSRGQPVFVEIK